jgi:hypothetical protein
MYATPDNPLWLGRQGHMTAEVPRGADGISRSIPRHLAVCCLSSKMNDMLCETSKQNLSLSEGDAYTNPLTMLLQGRRSGRDKPLREYLEEYVGRRAPTTGTHRGDRHTNK